MGGWGGRDSALQKRRINRAVATPGRVMRARARRARAHTRNAQIPATRTTKGTCWCERARLSNMMCVRVCVRACVCVCVLARARVRARACLRARARARERLGEVADVAAQKRLKGLGRRSEVALSVCVVGGEREIEIEIEMDIERD